MEKSIIGVINTHLGESSLKSIFSHVKASSEFLELILSKQYKLSDTNIKAGSVLLLFRSELRQI